MSQPADGAMIAALSAATIPVVTVGVNFLKPFVEQLPWADPANPADKPTHDATLQLLNTALTACVMALCAVVFGYVSDPASLWVLGVQIIGVTLGADFTYRSSAKSAGGGGIVSSVASGLSGLAAPAPTSVATAFNASLGVPLGVPLHQQALPTMPATDERAAPAGPAI